MKGISVPTKGKLEEYSVNRLLQMLSEENLSGCLTVRRAKTKRSLYVRKGTLIYASSTAVQDRLGEIFIIQGKLTRSVVDAAFKKGKRLKTQLGMILLVDGHINAQDLFQAATAQVVAILERMRSWRKGDFVFEEGEVPEPGTVLMHIPLALYLGAADRDRERAERPAKAARAEKAPKKKKKPSKKARPDVLELDESALRETPREEAPAAEMFPEASREEEAVPNAEPGPAEEVPEGIGWHDVTFDDERETDRLQPPAEDPGDFPDGSLKAPPAPGIEEGEGSEAAAAKLVEEIVFHVQELRRRAGRGPHVLLGVGSNATAEEVHDAYHYLARLLHPDQRPAGLPEDAARESEELMKDVVSAYGEINAARAATKGAPAAAPPPVGRIISDTTPSVDSGDASRRLFYRAKEFIAKGNYWQAADAMRQVVRMRPREALYRNLLGFCLMQTGRRLHEAEEHIREAVRLDPGNPDYITNLGLVYKAGRFYKKAREMFQQALVYDKKHQLARQELKKLPREAEPSKSGRSFWQKLRGR